MEIDQCKRELKQLKGLITPEQYVPPPPYYLSLFPLSLHSLLTAYHFSCSPIHIECVTNIPPPPPPPSSRSQQPKSPRKRGVPPYPKYILTAETEEYLKKPTFDIWHWEPNEMVSLMEHMYQDLGLVAHFHMNHITLRRWLVRGVGGACRDGC